MQLSLVFNLMQFMLALRLPGIMMPAVREPSARSQCGLSAAFSGRALARVSESELVQCIQKLSHFSATGSGRTRTPCRGLPVRLGPLETPSQPRSGLAESRRVASRDSDQNARLGASAPRASSGPCVPSRLRGGGAPPHPPLACHLQVPEIQIGQTLCVAPSK